MYQLISRKIKEVTPDLAESFLETNLSEGQRGVKQKHLKYLCGVIEDGLFTIGHIAIAHQGWNGGDPMMADGQHTCHSVILTGKNVPAVVEEYNCKTPEDFALLYRQFNGDLPRSLADNARPEAKALGLVWSSEIINKVLSGVGFLENHNSTSLHKNKRVESLKKYIPEGDFINDILSCVSASENKHLRRSPVIAAMIVTFRKCSADAETFWGEVRDGENLKSSSPTLKLRNYLLSTNTAFGRGVNAPSLNKAASTREMYCKCIIAWNAYRRGDSTILKYYADKETPKAI